MDRLLNASILVYYYLFTAIGFAPGSTACIKRALLSRIKFGKPSDVYW